MGKVSVNLQDSFLNQIRKENNEVKIALVDGSFLTGFVKGFDNFTIIINSKGNQHLIYKHAVAQLISRKLAPRNEEYEKKPVENVSVEMSNNDNSQPAVQDTQNQALQQKLSPKKSDTFNPIDISNIKK